MYHKNQRPSEIIALQKKVIEDQENIIATLKGALVAAGVGTPAAEALPEMGGLTRQESAMVGALCSAYPRIIDKYDLLEFLPGYDNVEERQVQVVSVTVHHVRRKLGADAIENVRGVGYRLGASVYEKLRNGRVERRAPVAAANDYELRLAA